MSVTLTARFHSSLDEIPPGAWNALSPDDNPFLAHAFLSGLEQHGCIDPNHGWLPHHLGLYEDERLVAAAPLYIKLNSHGEYVFDWSWASAYARYGLDYYPKLLCAIPYSPVTGPRLLVGDNEDADALRDALIGAIRSEIERRNWSSAHINFTMDADAHALRECRWLPRFDWQYHWINRGWRDFEDFLSALNHKKRKNIRQERSRAQRTGIVCEVRHGDELDDGEWQTLHDLYRSTFDYKGNFAALTPQFFRHLGRTMPRNVVAVLCRHDDGIIAGTLMLRSRDTLYGRYWGTFAEVRDLHFEACYYQGIEYCLRHGLHRFEPGAQGQHKMARGFLPTRTDSFHWLADPRFRAAVGEALMRESAAMDEYHAELMAHSPYARST